ncbi:hypothetical protein DFP72DRAFT_859559 [Ephemerocybe angulata]|uniref:Uncharacterized protein n=1 Tax=Ephemerocybe angulata TaxID=980116 RepID=A0A8H6LUW8_9AGAR|nr:hypothetical protein DFP72DRAFT_859559 [Tulosesus angulatus]
MVTRWATRNLREHAQSSEDAERMERHREVSRRSSRKHYHKDIDGSRARGAARQRAVRARKRALLLGLTVTPQPSLGTQQEASRESSRKHYYKDIAASREKCAARARKYREAKKRHQMKEASSMPLPSTPQPSHPGHDPLQLRSCRDDIQAPPILSPLPPSSPLPATPQYRSNFRRLAMSSSDEASEDGGEMSDTSSLPALPPSPLFQAQNRLPRLPIGPDFKRERKQILEQYSEEDQLFLRAVYDEAMSQCDMYGRAGYRIYWQRAYKKHENQIKGLENPFNL